MHLGVILLLAGCSSNPWLGAEIKHEGPKPDARVLLEQCVNAQGGLDAVARIDSAMHSGTIGIPELGWTGTFTIWQRQPRMVVQEFEINGVGQFIAGTNGQAGWNISKQNGAKLMSQVELEHFLKMNEIGASTNIAKGCDGAVVTRMVAFAGQATWEVAMSCPEGKRTAWINVANSLPVGIALAPVAANEIQPMVSYLDDWFDFQGLRIPRFVASRSGWITIETRTMVSSGAAVDVERFAPPEAIRSSAGLPPSVGPVAPNAEARDSAADATATYLGTGFFVAPDGFIVTADHVIGSGRDVLVIDANGERRQASVIRRAPAIDIAVLKVDGESPNFVSFADSSELALGQSAFTIGFPLPGEFGTSPKYTDGSVSSTSGPQDHAEMFQVSIPIQEGNSGGPIVDLQGRVLGVVSFGIRRVMVENVSWGVKASMVAALLMPAERAEQKPAPTREAAIQRVTRSVCRVVSRAN
jgi:S1-C subfamily serine protease